MKRLLLTLTLLAASIGSAYAQTQVWNCGATLGAGAFGVPSLGTAAEVCAGGNTCGTQPSGYVTGKCELLSAAAPTDFVHASTAWVSVASLGLVPVVPVPTVAHTFTWVPPTSNTDGTVAGAMTYNVYLDAKLLNTAPITAPSYAAVVPVGVHSVTATAVLISDGVEGDQCAPVSFGVTVATKPGTVTGLTVK